MTRRPLSRRGFLLATGGVLAGVTGVGVDAFGWAPRRVQVSRHEVLVSGLPGALDGLTILHLTDLHLYAGMHEAARRAMRLADELSPDVTVITGDLVEHTSQLPELGPWLAACRGRMATVVTLGNWEHQVRVPQAEMERLCSAAGAQLLVNAGAVVERGGARLGIAGLDDPRAGIPDPTAAVRDLRDSDPTLWLFHAPGYADLLARRGLPPPAFALAGHTHGGQIRPPLMPPIVPPASGRFVSGWYRDTFGPLYVGRGIGTSGIRARFRCTPEVGHFTLRRA